MTEKINRAINATKLVFDTVGLSGGELHIVLDDLNVKYGDIMWCKKEIDTLFKEHNMLPSVHNVYIACIFSLIHLTEEERIWSISVAADMYKN